MAKQNYEHVGGGSYDVYRPKKKKPFWKSVGEVIGGVILFMIALWIIGAIFG